MMDLNQLADWLGGQRLEGNDQPTMTSVVATAVGQSANGKVKVVLDGDVIGVEDADGNQTGSNEIEIPTSAHVEKGDNVIITLFGGAMSKPLYTQVQGSGDRTYNLAALAQAASEAAEIMAAEAYDAVEATNEHFFADSNGIHVATEENDATTGPNLLANSVGILLRDGTLIRTAQTASGFAVYDGLGNQAGNIVALLGDVITLGKSGEQQLVLDQDAFELLNTSGNPFFHVGYSDDAIGPSGSTVTAPFLLFDVTGSIASRTIGAYSVAYGMDVHAEKYCSAAFGLGIKVANAEEFACGRYNEIDTTGNKLFSVGCGLGENYRVDAFSVYSSDGAKVFGDAIPRMQTLYDNPTGSFTGVITLSDDIQNYEYLEVFYKDTDGVSSSVKIYDFAAGSKFKCSTENYYIGGLGVSIKCRTMYFISYTTLDTYFTAQSGGNKYWTGEYVYDGSQHLNTGDYIGITRIVGYR